MKERLKDRKTEKPKDSEKERQKDRETERQHERKTEIQKDRKRQNDRVKGVCGIKAVNCGKKLIYQNPEIIIIND